mgnify:CR=1 FL=1
MSGAPVQRHYTVDDIVAITRRYWGIAELRPLQQEAISAGVSRRDSLVVLPTGGGKSLCYQVPPVLDQRTDVVVSPLISLMKDQVDRLRSLGYPAAALHSQLTSAAASESLRELAEGRCRLLFVSPERLLQPALLERLERCGVSAFAIDEAHCISHWGHDFRPEYRNLQTLRSRFPEASLHAYTATATPRVQADIVEQLRLVDPAILVGTFDRPNLIYRVVPRGDLVQQVLETIGRHAGEAVIVYCISRNDTEELARFLEARNVRAAFYHAGMEGAGRRSVQDRFAAREIDVIVATVAFGMGIDRADIRCVIHAAGPKSIEHYQQETGRAGRDGLPAECVLFYSPADTKRWESLIEKNARETPGTDPRAVSHLVSLVGHVRRFATAYTCRHKLLSEYFGQAYNRGPCGACDVCLGEVRGQEDGTVTAQQIISCVARVGERFGVGHVTDVLLGEDSERIRQLGHDRLSTYGLLKDAPRKWLQRCVFQLVDQELLTREGDEYPILRLNAASWEVLRGQRAVQLPSRPEQQARRSRKSAKQAAARVSVTSQSRAGPLPPGSDRETRPARPTSASPPPDEVEGDVDAGLFESLRELRREFAQRTGVPAYVIFHDRTLRDLARRRPTTIAGLRRIRGVGHRKASYLGQAFVDRIAAYCRQHALEPDVILSEPTDLRRYAERRSRGGEARARAFEMFERGAPVEEVSAALQRAVSTVWGYLNEFVSERRPESISAWVPPQTQRLIEEAVRVVGMGPLRPIQEQIGGQCPWPEIKLVLTHLRATRAASRDARDES